MIEGEKKEFCVFSICYFFFVLKSKNCFILKEYVNFLIDIEELSKR